MKAVIPVKASSLRILNKNFRNFCDGKSLLDIALSKILGVLQPEDVFVSCEDPQRRAVVEKLGVNFCLRDESLCDNDTPFHEWFNRTIDQVPGKDDIAWCQVTDPLFNQYHECIEKWTSVREQHDSLVVAYVVRKYMLNEQHKPMGFGFGRKHVKSQLLPAHYELPFTLSILKRSTIRNDGYHVGKTPYWFCSHGPHVDIDTPEEFDFAGKLYKTVLDANESELAEGSGNVSH
jgi:CMP-N-acetylneuraminic acid synthetase